ncbi:MAG: LamG-like jellyroll fold domain-containing protein [Nanoarchaeota archaeon]
MGLSSLCFVNWSQKGFAVFPSAILNNMSQGTIDFWIYPTIGDPSESWIIRPLIPGSEYHPAISWHKAQAGDPNNTISFFSGTNSKYVMSTPGTVMPFTWTHIAITWDPMKTRIYVNGILDVDSNEIFFIVNGTSNVYIGGWEWGYHAQGCIDELRISNISRTFSSINSAPVLQPIPNQTINEGDLFNAVPLVNASDPDGDPITITYLLPINSTGQLQTTYDNAGSYIFSITASDGILSDTKYFTLTINNVNRAPTINTFSPTSTINVDEGTSLALTIDANDPDGDALSYKWYLDNNEVTTTQNYTYSPDYNSQGEHNITVIVLDGNLQTPQYWNITVNDVTPPSSGGGGGGGGGGGCKPSWKYENWGQCKDGKKYRKVIDENQCKDNYEEWLECTNQTKEEIKEERKEEIEEGKEGKEGSGITGAAVSDLAKEKKGIGQYVSNFTHSVKETFVKVGQAVKNFVVKIKEVLWGK